MNKRIDMYTRIILAVSLLIINVSILCGQVTYSPSVKSQNSNCTIEKVQLTDNETIVTIKVPRSKQWGGWVSFSSATVLVPVNEWSISDARQSDLRAPSAPPLFNNAYDAYLIQALKEAIARVKKGRQLMSEKGYLIRSLGRNQLDARYKTTDSDHYFELHFDRLPVGVEEVYIIELAKGEGFEWYGIKINNPIPQNRLTTYNSYSIKTKIDSQNDGIVGIYEGTAVQGRRYTLGCIKENGIYKLIYLGCNGNMPYWKEGEVKCVLTSSATNGLYKGNWYMEDKTSNDNCFIAFKGATMEVFLDGQQELYIKMYPNSNAPNSIPADRQMWGGTGFALNNGYIVTNYHVVEGATSIKVRGINGDFNTDYNASLVSTDKFNDLALIKIEDNRFVGFGTIPYKVKTTVSEVGEEIFVLGYPLTSTMGDEIKLTTGVISSKSGYQGDMSLYQISAPVQPGNSGGPLFDKQGNLIGIISAKHEGAENVGYAIKTSYLKNLVESNTFTSSILPSSGQISGLPLTSQIKKVRSFVFMIRCSTGTYSANIDGSRKNSNYGGNSNNNYDSGINSDYYSGRLDTCVVINPSVSATHAKNKGLKIKKVQVTPTETIVDLEFDNSLEQRWMIKISPDTYIESVNTGKKYKLIKAEGIPVGSVGSGTYSFLSPYEKRKFRLIFPALSEITTSFNLIENETNSPWKFYGIKLK